MKYFKLYFDTDRTDNLVCEVEFITEDESRTKQWYEQVFVEVPCYTVYYGASSEQPKFVLMGKYNQLKLKNNKLTII